MHSLNLMIRIRLFILFLRISHHISVEKDGELENHIIVYLYSYSQGIKYKKI